MSQAGLLVTGGNGFVGSRLCSKVMGAGKFVCRALHSSDGSSGIVVGDIGPQTNWREAFSQSKSETVVHLAARVHVMKDMAADPLAEFQRVNVDGTLNLAQQAAAAGFRRFIFLSSVKVNGEQTIPRPDSLPKGEGNVTCFTEQDTPIPEDAYGISKLEAEQGLQQLAQKTGMEVVIIRPPLVYGPGVKANFLNMMRWLHKGVPLPLGAIYGNKRSLVALDNLVDFIITCLDHPAAANQTFLVSDGEDLSTTELLTRTAEALGKPARLLPVPQKLLVFALKLFGKDDLARRLCGSLQVDISKARDLLGWTPPVTVDEGLRKTAQAFLAAQRNH